MKQTKKSIPKLIWINHNKWRVLIKTGIIQDDYGVECAGLCDTTKRQIILASPDYQVFLHEYIHAVLYEYAMYRTSLTPDVEEMICEFVSRELVKLN